MENSKDVDPGILVFVIAALPAATTGSNAAVNDARGGDAFELF